MANLEGKRVAILATDMFEQDELIKPQEALEEAGAETVIIAPHDGELQGALHFDKGDHVLVDMTLDEADPADFDAALLPGGALNADNLRAEKKAQEFVQATEAAGKPLAVICHGSWLLVSAGLVDGRTLTSFHTIADDLKNAGAEWVDKEVTVDGNWVSSRKPDDIPAFNEVMLDVFSRVTAKNKA